MEEGRCERGRLVIFMASFSAMPLFGKVFRSTREWGRFLERGENQEPGGIRQRVFSLKIVWEE